MKDAETVVVSPPPLSRDEPEAAAEPPALRRRHPFYALSFRNYRLFFFGQLVSVAGTWMQTVAQQWLVYDLTDSPRWLGIVTGAGALPSLLLSVVGGQVADRYSRRGILLVTQVGFVLLALTLALLATGWWVPIAAWHIAVLAGVMGLISAFNMPAQHAFLSELVEDRAALGNAIALNSLRFNIARFIGPLVAGVVLVKVGPAACFALNALTYQAVILSLLLIRVDSVPREKKRLAFWEGFGYVWRTPRVLRVLLLAAVSSVFGWSVSTIYPVFADNFGQGAQGFSAILAASGAGAAVGGFLVAAFGERLPRRRLVYGGALAFSGGLLFIAGAPAFPLLLASVSFNSFAAIIFAINANTTVQEDVPDTLRGRVMAVWSLVMGLMPVGGFLVGFLAEHFGAVRAVYFNASVCLGVTVALYLWSRTDRSLLRPRS